MSSSRSDAINTGSFGVDTKPHGEMPLHPKKGEGPAAWQLISLRECFYLRQHFQEISFSSCCSFLANAPVWSRGAEENRWDFPPLVMSCFDF